VPRFAPAADRRHRRGRWQDRRCPPRAIITDHLDRLAQHDVNGLARLLKRTPAMIDAACFAPPSNDPTAMVNVVGRT